MSRAIAMNASTLSRYLTVLETLFLIWPLPAWFTNLGKRLAKSPKLHMTDSGLAGRLLESFLTSEVRGLIYLRQALGAKFARGVVLYAGVDIKPLGEKIYAVPVGELFADVNND
ncbi:MAG: DUF4143 domain-containing protein [Candidatus Adiutrix sp.]|jgi:predicted AAA+ superfamily ATPase|nr:DUF4143 domain-containing protein [Candidatus Adiutrix sp.]